MAEKMGIQARISLSALKDADLDSEAVAILATKGADEIRVAAFKHRNLRERILIEISLKKNHPLADEARKELKRRKDAPKAFVDLG